jgi:signal transduction histidine kinase
LHWNLQVDYAPEVSPNAVLQILRLVQEALNNALKHAKATNIHLDFNYDEVDGQLTISVADDGVGIGSDGQPVYGRGQKNMLARARALGGKLSVSNSQPGTLRSRISWLSHGLAWLVCAEPQAMLFRTASG